MIICQLCMHPYHACPKGRQGRAGAGAWARVLAGACTWGRNGPGFRAEGKAGLSLVSVMGRLFPSEIAVASGYSSQLDGVIQSMQIKTVIWIDLTVP